MKPRDMEEYLNPDLALQRDHICLLSAVRRCMLKLEQQDVDAAIREIEKAMGRLS